MGAAADSWQALMDRLLILGSDRVDEKLQLEENICQLVDIYYDALDAPKKGGKKVTHLFTLIAVTVISEHGSNISPHGNIVIYLFCLLIF